MKKVVLATRRSPLALAQAELAAAHLRSRLGAEVELLTLVTTGDRQTDWSLEAEGGKGLFTSELEQALRRGEADLAVHSAKDLPGEGPDGLTVAGYLPRADARDVLVRRVGVDEPGRIATGSPRRRSQAALRWSAAEFCPIRGNVDTRLRRIAAGGLADATFLAAAGLGRLGIAAWPGLEFVPLEFADMVPAVGQGAVAIQCRSGEAGRYAAVLDRATGRAIAIERSLQAALGAGCHTAFGAHVEGASLHLFHPQGGFRRLALEAEDLDDPATAVRILRSVGLAG